MVETELQVVLSPTLYTLSRSADSLFPVPVQQQNQKSQGSTLIGLSWVRCPLLDQSTMAREVESCKKTVTTVGVWETNSSQKKSGR